MNWNSKKEYKVGKYKVITLCGSTRFKDDFMEAQKRLTFAGNIITPINLFMYTKINADGTISVEAPLSKAGDKIALEALMDITLVIAACSVSERKCNSGKCTPIQVIISEGRP